MKRSSFIFEKNHFRWRRNPTNTVITVEEEIEWIGADGIGNLIDLPRQTMFIDGEWGNLKTVVDGG